MADQKEKIPCFIIHSYTPTDLDHHRIHNLALIPSFVQWSEAELLKPGSNGYEFVALKHGQLHSRVLSDRHISRVATTKNLIKLVRGLSISYNQGWHGILGVTHLLHCFSLEQIFLSDLPPEDIVTATPCDAPALPPSKFQLLHLLMERVDKK
jgi:hypothetical protein